MKRLVATAVAAAATMVSGCDGGGNGTASNEAAAGAKADGDTGGKTIAAGVDQNSRFFQAAKAAGLDATLAGSEPYTVLVPSDEAFGKISGGALADPANPQNRAELTRILTLHILPGTVLLEDIEKALEAGKGKTQLPTMGGGTVTAARDGGRMVLSDAGGTKASIAKSDQRFSNGVVHHIDAVLMPAQGDAAAGAAAPAQ